MRNPTGKISRRHGSVASWLLHLLPVCDSYLAHTQSFARGKQGRRCMTQYLFRRTGTVVLLQYFVSFFYFFLTILFSPFFLPQQSDKQRKCFSHSLRTFQMLLGKQSHWLAAALMLFCLMKPPVGTWWCRRAELRLLGLLLSLGCIHFIWNSICVTV